jgi:hypothetical protein
MFYETSLGETFKSEAAKNEHGGPGAMSLDSVHLVHLRLSKPPSVGSIH